MTSEPEDDDIEEGVYQISLLPPLDSHQLEAMFEVLVIGQSSRGGRLLDQPFLFIELALYKIFNQKFHCSKS